MQLDKQSTWILKLLLGTELASDIFKLKTHSMHFFLSN